MCFSFDLSFVFCRDYSYQDAKMYFSQSPIQTLKDQTRHLLHEDSMVASRNRAIICSQTMSISRYDELTFWKFGDMAPFTYSTDLPCVSKQEINVLYILQKHKKGQVRFGLQRNMKQVFVLSFLCVILSLSRA